MDESGKTYTREFLIKVAQELAKKLGRDTFSRAEFVTHTGISEYFILRQFENYNDLVRAAGLVPNEKNVRLDDDALFRDMHDVFIKLGGIKTKQAFAKVGKFSPSVYRRFGSWPEVLEKFRTWCAVHASSFPYLQHLPSADLVSARPTPSDDHRRERENALGQQWETKGGRQYGELINFRGLLHAPVNEQGVVFLFGMIAHELGYIVESVQTGYPDCEAKRRVKKKNSWERVRIEFEYLSRNFREHGHDPKECDLVVCWKNNWNDCPVEILELCSVLKELDAS